MNRVSEKGQMHCTLTVYWQIILEMLFHETSVLNLLSANSLTAQCHHTVLFVFIDSILMLCLQIMVMFSASVNYHFEDWSYLCWGWWLENNDCKSRACMQLVYSFCLQAKIDDCKFLCGLLSTQLKEIVLHIAAYLHFCWFSFCKFYKTLLQCDEDVVLNACLFYSKKVLLNVTMNMNLLDVLK